MRLHENITLARKDEPTRLMVNGARESIQRDLKSLRISLSLSLILHSFLFSAFSRRILGIQSTAYFFSLAFRRSVDEAQADIPHLKLGLGVLLVF